MPFWRQAQPATPSIVDKPCPDCGHDESDHPWPGRQAPCRCAACIWEEDTGQRDEADMCARRFPVLVATADIVRAPRQKRAFREGGW